MASLFDRLKTNTDLETKGVWLNFGDAEIKIGRAGGSNMDYAKAEERYFEPHRRAADLGMLAEDVANEALRNVFADAVIFGWRTKTGTDGDGKPVYVDTIEGPDGKPLAFTRDNVLFVMRELPELFRMIRVYAGQWKVFQAQQREIASGN